MSVAAGPSHSDAALGRARPMHLYDYDQGYGRDLRTSLLAQRRHNSCLEGSVIGGLLGAGLGAALSRGNGRWIGVPVGGAAGADRLSGGWRLTSGIGGCRLTAFWRSWH